MEELRTEPPRFSGLLLDAFRIPATGLTCLAAITVTSISWITDNLSGIQLDSRGFFVLPWTPITSSLAHVDVLHLLLNMAWMWRFGGWIERRIGTLRTLLLYGLLAVVSAAGEFAWNFGGVGLSGVVYGLFGLLWVRRRADRELAAVLNRFVVILFVVWFFLCILLTVSNVYPIANAAHLLGAIAGAGIGWAWNREGMARRVAVLVCCTGFVLVIEAATVGRSFVNSGPGLAFEHTRRAHEAVERGDFAEGLSQGLLAVENDATNGYAHWYLGCSQVMTGREMEGLASLREANRLGTRTIAPEKAWMEWMEMRLSDLASSSDWTTINRLANEMLHIDPYHVSAWTWVGQTEFHAGRSAEACSAFERAFELDPNLPTARDNQVWAKFTRGKLALEAGDVERARGELEAGLVLAPEDGSLLALKQNIAWKSRLGR